MSIEISKMIVHKLNIKGNLPILSDSCIDIESLEDTQEALDFFVTHIEQSKNQGFVKKCQFWDLNDNTVKKSIENIIEKIENSEELEAVLIEESKKMALKFAKLIRGTASKSDGSLFFLLYTVEGKNSIAIMKMDPDTGIEVRDDLSIMVRKDMLPSKREKLHKAAFIKCLDQYNSNQLHLFALDRQKSSEEPAKYFMESFLNVKVLPDDENLTIEYQKTMTKTFQEVLPDNVFMEFSQRLKRRFQEERYFTLEDDFPPLIRDLLPSEEQDSDLNYYMDIVKHDLRKKHPGEVTGFMPVAEKINNDVYRTRDKGIEITINKNIDKELYDISIEDGTLTLIIHPESGVRQIK